MKEKTLPLTEGAIGSTLLKFAIPFLLTSLLQALYGAVDLFIVGQYADSADVSAVAIGSQLMQTITGIVLGISMGATVLIGNCIGEKNDKGAVKAVGTINILFILIAVILTPIMIFGTNLSVSLIHTPVEAINYARQYIFICACGISFIVGYNAVSGIFKGIGDSKTPMYFIAIACLVNIVADFILVGAFNMGASGAAIGTILAQGISLIISIVFIKKRGFSFKIDKSHIKIDKYSLGRIIKVGLPLAFQDALVNISFLVITVIVNGMGIVASAAMYLKSYSFDCILVAFIFCMNSYFSGCGRSMIAFVHSMIATFGVRIPMSYFMSRIAKVSLFEMGLASPVAFFVSVSICFGYFIWLKRYKDKISIKSRSVDVI